MRTVPDIIEALGKSSGIARDTGIPLTTIESWKGAGFIPEWRRPALLKLAKSLKVELSEADFPPRKPKAERKASQVAA